MTWTYEPGLLGDAVRGPLMQTRRLLGDVTAGDPWITDEELAYLLTAEGDPLRAAMQAAFNLAAQYSVQVDYNDPDDLSEKLSQRGPQFRAIAEQLERRLARHASPYAGGITKADVLSHRQDTSLVQPEFFQGMDEEPVWHHDYVDSGTDPVNI